KLCDNRVASLENIETEEYNITSQYQNLLLTWKNPYSLDGNITQITNQTIVKLRSLTVMGVESSDQRFQNGVYYLQKLGIRGLYTFQILSNSLDAVESKVIQNYGPETLSLTLKISSCGDDLNTYLKRSLNNLKEIYMNSTIQNWDAGFAFDENIFKGQVNLKKISISGFNISKLTPKTFIPLISLTNLSILKCSLKNVNIFTESYSLQPSLEYLIFDIKETVRLEYFKNYKKLQVIEVGNHVSFYNFTAVICKPKDILYCSFALGVNGISCPADCACVVYELKELRIDCSGKGLTQIPALPIPIAFIRKTALNFQNNSLKQLPNNTLKGYYNLNVLDVSKNFLRGLEINRLPKYLDYLDISFNKISTLNNEVIEYLKDVIIFKQFGNLWILECDNAPLKEFFRALSGHKYFEGDTYSRARNDAGAEMFTFVADPVNETHIMVTKNKNQPNEQRMLFSDEQLLMQISSKDDYTRRMSNELLDILDRQISSDKYEKIIFQHLGEPCLFKCECCYDQVKHIFKIDCNGKDFYYGIPYPISPKNNTILQNIKTPLSLHISQGNLEKISIGALPKSLVDLDVSMNRLESLDDDVVDFLLQNKVSVNLKKNPWKCDCKSRKFLSFLRDYDSGEYNLALDRCNIPLEDCPSSCVCCLNKSVWTSFIVDCREQELLNVPEISDNVTYLDLRNNSITGMTIMDRDMLDRKGHGVELKLFLSGNPWTCECIDLDFVFFMKNISKTIEDFSNVQCLGIEKAMVSVEESDICPSALPYYLTLAISLITLIIFINFLVWLRHPILIWFYEHDICLSLAARQEIDLKKKFDAFLCFTHKDEDLVAEFVERLETSRPQFKLCFYLRDWLLGVSIPDCITNSVKDSRRIIILMTNNFLESTWGRLEFRLALHATSQDRCKRLIVVLYPEVKNFDDLDSELRTYMVFNTYLKRNDPNFWNKLIYSMPHSKLNQN
ncbi:hypothetical protein KR026_005628, partial [Drosophila bipectinata]